MVEIRDGERITGEGDLGVTILADLDQIGVAEVRSQPGVVHALRNQSVEQARLLDPHAPGGFVEHRRALAELGRRRETPDAAFYARHDVFDPD
ncbi:MAG: hypothetical protein R6W48_11295 [Gaiellaceae bacterium]